MLLRHYLEQGLSKSAIARRLGVSRRTLHHWIGTGQLYRDLDRGEACSEPGPPVVSVLYPVAPTTGAWMILQGWRA